jgi:hypothetical protein
LANGPNRVNITNNSHSPGILVAGTNQQVGNIDGSGTTRVNAGSDLTADHIIQSALVIGGTSKNPGLVTIDASDSSGNSLASLAVLRAPTSTAPLRAGANLADPSSYASNDHSLSTSLPIVSSLTTPQATVPEPTSAALVVIGCLVFGGAAVRRSRQCHASWITSNQ